VDIGGNVLPGESWVNFLPENEDMFLTYCNPDLGW
jgi:hypothetical protein